LLSGNDLLDHFYPSLEPEGHIRAEKTQAFSNDAIAELRV
jgi:hypothetical protein